MARLLGLFFLVTTTPAFLHRRAARLVDFSRMFQTPAGSGVAGSVGTPTEAGALVAPTEAAPLENSGTLPTPTEAPVLPMW